MNMIAHQAIGEYRHAVSARVLIEPIEVGDAVLVIEKDDFATIPTLCHMMWHAWEDRAGVSRHALKIA